MKGFIEELKEEHTQILELLRAAGKGQGMMRDDWKQALFNARKLFESHLAKEDQLLYPEIAACGNTEECTTATGYGDEMKSITGNVRGFLTRYRDDPSGGDFNKDYAELVYLLEKRIAREEQELFPLYEKISG